MKEKSKNDNYARLSIQLEEFKKALEQSELQYQNLLKNIPGIIYLSSCDEHWTVHYMTMEIEKISGYPASDFINNNVRSYASIIHPDDVDLIDQAVQESLSQNKAYEIEYRIIRKDGEIVWLYEKGQKVSDADGKIWLNGIIFDINKQKQTAIALDIATEEWRVTFDAIPHAILLLNREACIIKCNRGAEELLGKSKKKLIGQRYCNMIYGKHELSKHDPYKKMIKSGHKETFTSTVSEKSVEITFSPIINPEGEIYGSVLLIIEK